MKKSFVKWKLAVLLPILSMTATGCSCIPMKPAGFDSKTLDEIDLTAEEDYYGELKIRTYNQDTEVEIMNAYIKGFKEKYPNIDVDYSTYALDSYYSILINDFGTCAQNQNYDNAVDIYWIAQDNISSFYEIGLMFALTEIDKIDDGFDKNDLVEESVETCVVESEELGEQMYIMPRDFSQVVMYFNQDIFDIAGVDYPTAQMSKEEFVTMLDDLREGIDNSNAKNDYGSYYRDVVKYLVDVNALWDSWVWPLAKSFGGEVINEEGEAALDSDAIYEMVDFWKEMREKEYVGDVVTGNVGVNFRMQQSAIYFHTRSVMSDIYSSDGRNIKGVQNLGVTSMPQFGDTYAIASGASGYAMYTNAPHKTEAWLFLKYIASEEGQNIFGKTGNGIPSLKSLLDDPNAEWRKFTHDAMGTAFDADAFVYGMNFATKPYTNTREFFKYLSVSKQESALECLQNCLLASEGQDTSATAIRAAIKNQNQRLDQIIHRKG